jgi:hypothetical protein
MSSDLKKSIFFGLWLLLAIVALFAISMSFSETAKADETVSLSLENTIVFNAPFVPEIPSVLAARMRFLEQVYPGTQKYLVIHSPGGFVTVLEDVAERMKEFPNVILITTWGFSCAAMLPQMISNEHYIHRNGSILFHRVRIGVGDSKIDGAVMPLPPTRNSMNFPLHLLLPAVNKMLEEEVKSFTIVATKIKMAVSTLLEKASTEWYIDAPSAMRNNIATKVVDFKCSKDLKQQMQDSDPQFALFCNK